MFLIMLIAVICYKVGILGQQANKAFSDLLILVVNPCVIIVAFQIPFEIKMLHGFLFAIAIAIFTHVIGIVLENIFVRGKDERSRIDKFAIIYSNCGFMGIPLINAVLGSKGVFYLTAYVTVTNILTWTQGYMLVQGEKFTIKNTLKSLFTPIVVGTVIGFILFFTRITLPKVIYDGLNYMSNMNTPLAMLVAGLSVVQADLRHVYKEVSQYRNVLCRQFLVPLLTLVFIVLIRAPHEPAMAMLIAAAAPTATMTMSMAIMYDKDYKYASELFSTSTLLSLITLPVIVYIGEIAMKMFL
jgi:predicted permease